MHITTRQFNHRPAPPPAPSGPPANPTPTFVESGGPASDRVDLSHEATPAADDAHRDFVKRNAYVLGADGSHQPLTTDQETQLAQSLSGFNQETLDSLQRNNVKYVIVDSSQTPQGGYPGRPDWKQWDPNVGAYTNHSYQGSNVVIPQTNINAADVAHETGHALDMSRDDHPPAAQDAGWTGHLPVMTWDR
jgi:hypothetical protein